MRCPHKEFLLSRCTRNKWEINGNGPIFSHFLMRQFYLEYKDVPILQQLVGEFPWGHNNILILSKIIALEGSQNEVERDAE